MSQDELLQRLSELIENMSFDYDRFSNSGKATYEEICTVLAELMG